MDRSQMVVANLRYQSSKGGKGFGKVRDLARYFQYRQDRDQHIPQEEGLERWVDHGLGNNFRQIAERCEAFKSEYVQAFFLVINPNPDLMALVPAEQQECFVKQLTESSLEAFFAERVLEVPEYSYAYHLRATLDAARRDNPHTHIILPGSYASWADGGRLPLYMNRGKGENHIALLHQVVEGQTERLLERYVGLDWERRFDAAHTPASIAEANTPPLNPQDWPLADPAALPEEAPHAQFTDSEGQSWQVWVATQEDVFAEDEHQVGFLLSGVNPAEEPRFVPRIVGLRREQAEAIADYMVTALVIEGAEVERVFQFAAQIGAMSEAERAQLFENSPSMSGNFSHELDL
jgi:hypothetical protein